MKKLLSALAGIAILAVIITAGCVTPVLPPTVTTPTGTPAVEEITPVQLIVVEKTGTVYNVGDSYVLELPSNPTTGYDWAVIDNGGLTITQKYQAPETELLGAGGYTIFTITPETAGTFSFTLKYMRSFEGEESTLYTYTDSITAVEFFGMGPMEEPRTHAVYTGSMDVKAGEYIGIVTSGNPTTGYVWTTEKTEGLTISEPKYMPADSKGLVGAGGSYYWLITADKAGTYVFKADYKRSFENDPITSFDLDLIFS